MAKPSNYDAFHKKLLEVEKVILGLGTVSEERLAEASDDLELEVDRTYSNETDPYGRRWAPRKVQGDGHPLLDDTGRMRRSFVFRVKRQGVTVTNTTSYATYHQMGSRTLPKRAVLPDRRGLPREWLEVFRRAITDQWDQDLKRVGFKRK